MTCSGGQLQQGALGTLLQGGLLWMARSARSPRQRLRCRLPCDCAVCALLASAASRVPMEPIEPSSKADAQLLVMHALHPERTATASLSSGTKDTCLTGSSTCQIVLSTVMLPYCSDLLPCLTYQILSASMAVVSCTALLAVIISGNLARSFETFQNKFLD